MLEIELPFPTSENRYRRAIPLKKFAKQIISKDGRKYKKDVAEILSGYEMITGAVAVKVILYFPEWRKADIDNRFKALFDALSEAGIYEDDSFICGLVTEKRKDADGQGRVIVQIKQLTSGVIVKKAGAWLE